MTFSKVMNSKSSSKDASMVAPCFSNVSKVMNIFKTDIVFAVSVFLCLLALIICPAITSIIILSIIGIIIINGCNFEKQTAR